MLNFASDLETKPFRADEPTVETGTEYMKQLVLKELAKMDFKVVSYAMRDFSRLDDLAEHLAWAYDKNDVTSGKMAAELTGVYESDNVQTI